MVSLVVDQLKTAKSSLISVVAAAAVADLNDQESDSSIENATQNRPHNRLHTRRSRRRSLPRIPLPGLPRLRHRSGPQQSSFAHHPRLLAFFRPHRGPTIGRHISRLDSEMLSTTSQSRDREIGCASQQRWGDVDRRITRYGCR